MSLCRRLAAAAWLLTLLSSAQAHDSWFAAPQAGVLTLATGNRYPVAEVGVAAAGLARAGCVGATLEVAAETPRALELRTGARGPLACWAELKAHEVTLTPELVETYFREIRPSDAVRARWAAQRGAGWSESYRKFARIESGTDGALPAELRRLRAPAGGPLEIVIDGAASLRAGQEAVFRVLADGAPMAGLSVELVGERSAIGVWSRSDAEGRLRLRLPFAGNWLLRATLLEPEPAPGRWRSRFVTLAFEAGPG